MATVPDKPTLEDLETKWSAIWEANGTYRFDPTRGRDEVYSIDTPPPTVSGQLHLGTAFGYIQVDAMARFQRMRGREVFYPIGWDDNGLPTERRVQNHYGVRCDPTMSHQDDLVVPDPDDNRKLISRANFLELCEALTEEDEKGFEDVFRTVGLSVDWSLKYATIDERSRRAAQRAFLRNLARGEAYQTEAPTLWDIDYQTAVAQAELEDRTATSAYHRLRFGQADGPGVEIETTRPELLAACVALVAHPEDPRYLPLFGTTVTTPVFDVAVPVLPHRLAEPDKGSGIAMVCTFGDTVDIVWWRELDLPTRPIIGRDGRLSRDTPAWLPERGAAVWPELAGATVAAARRKMVELLQADGSTVGDPRPVEHEVRYYEKGDRPLEIVTSRQWYIRNGARDEALRARLLEAGRELQWHPANMRIRFEHWVEGLNTDWLISRQRYFGVPFPVWYPVELGGEPALDQPILATEESLPVDPQTDAPPGYEEHQRGEPGGFVGDPDVMDTWATSSLTPQITCNWEDDPDFFGRTFPMDLRPQGPEIIRTWLFSTLLRSLLEEDARPWDHISINGWILDPDRKKMSKSKGNIVTPAQLVADHGADGVRYWSCSSAPGVDTAADAGQMRVGRRLALKLLNVTRFVLGLGIADATATGSAVATTELDRALLTRLGQVVDRATTAFDGYGYHRSLEQSEVFFWTFCDDFVELVKSRAYGDDPGAESARATLAVALDALLRLFAPFLPFAAEEAWSWWHDSSVHRAAWPSSDELIDPAALGDPLILEVASEVLGHIRKEKSLNRLSMRSPVDRVTVVDTAERTAALTAAIDDVKTAGVVSELVVEVGDTPSVTVELPVAEATPAS